MLPRSPWLESAADKKNEGVPTDENVAAILEAINPLFPTPHRITFEEHLAISCTALLKDLSKFFFNFSRAFISKVITFFPIFKKFFFLI